MFQVNSLLIDKYKSNILKKLTVKMSKYGEMVSVCQENINHWCISNKIVFEPRSLDLEGLVDYIFVTSCYSISIL